MKILKDILKAFLIMILCIILVLSLLFFSSILLLSIQDFLIADKEYLILTNNRFYFYVVIFVLLLTFIIISWLHKKKLFSILSEDILYVSKFLLHKWFLIGFGILSFVMFGLIITNYELVYRDRITVHKLFQKERVYEYHDINEVQVSIKKHWNGTLEPVYKLIFDKDEVEVLGKIIHVKNEKDSYDNNIYIDTKIKELEIPKKVNDKYLKDFNKTLADKYADKMNILFDKKSD